MEISILFTWFFCQKCLLDQRKHTRSSTKISMTLPTASIEALQTSIVNDDFRFGEFHPTSPLAVSLPLRNCFEICLRVL
jgi:hypothetical protein